MTLRLTKKTKDLLSILDYNKVLILGCLASCSDNLCGCDLIEKLGIPKNLLSYHIKILEELDFIEATKCGRKRNYRLSKKKVDKTKEILRWLEI